MPLEIERKFLLRPGEALPESEKVLRIKQGYLSTNAKKVSVRVRISNDQGFLTIKGPAAEGHFARSEYEYEIPIEEAEELLTLCDGTPVVKQRHHIHENGLLWEVDFFEEANEGLIVVEVELPEENTPLIMPAWIGDEVTGQSRYLNSELFFHPFNTWNE